MGTYKPEPNLNGTLEPEVPKIPDAQSSEDSTDSEKSHSVAETPTVVEIPRKGKSKPETVLHSISIILKTTQTLIAS